VSATPNLAIEHILQSQAQKEVTANEAFDALDQAIAGLLEVDVSAGGPITVDSAAALACKMLRLTGTLAADAEVVVPDNRKPYFVHNATAGGFAVTVRTAAGAGVIVGASPDSTAVVYCDGVDVLAISAGTAGGRRRQRADRARRHRHRAPQHRRGARQPRRRDRRHLRLDNHRHLGRRHR
jgi:hypothetical protein